MSLPNCHAMGIRDRHWDGGTSAAAKMASALALVIQLFLSQLELQAAEVSKEPDLKVALVYSITKFVEWPEVANTNAPLVIGIIGKGSIVSAFGQIQEQGKTVAGRPLLITNITSAAEARVCQVVFICVSEKGRIVQLLNNLKDINSLTISEIPGFCAHGGVINLILAGDFIKMEINLEAARRKGLTISSKLLRQATIIQGAKE